MIVFGVVGFFVKGINFGIDFKPGLIEDVAVVPTAIELTYDGTAVVSVETSTQKIDLIVTGAGSDSLTYSFPYVEYDTVGKMVSALNSIDGVNASAKVSDSVKALDFFGSSAKNTVLGDESYNLYFNPENPTIIEDFIRAIGATPVVYPYRNECCGGYISLREKEMAKNMCDKIKESASGFGAEMLITACPLCMYNLNKSEAELPVYYFTELLAEALGVKEEVK